MATITVTDLASKLDTDPRTARKFLRSITPADSHPGKGSRWSIEARDVRSLQSKFKKFEAAQVEAKNAREATPEDAPDEVEVDAPTDEELLAIDAE